MENVIRDIETRDAAGYITLIKQVDQESLYMIREPGEFNKSKSDIEKEIKKSIERRNYFRVLEFNNQIVGYAKLSRSKKKRLAHKAEFTIAIMKSETGKGLGSAFMKDCIDWCQENGVERLDLKVATENIVAINLYTKYGFEKTGDYFKDVKLSNNEYLDFIHMSLFLYK